MKSTSTALTNRIAAYKAQVDPLSIDPVLDGGIKQDLLDTLNNKARNKSLLVLSSIPNRVLPVPSIGNNGEYYIYEDTSAIVYFKSAGEWSAIESSNDMLFFNDGSDGVRRYYSLSEDLLSSIEIHSIDFGDISGNAVKYTTQSLTTVQQNQARTNIDAAAKTYVDNLFSQLIKSGAVGTECAGSVKPWFGPESIIPTGWAKIAETQTWFLKADYPDLYAALGGESNPWGLTTTSFSIPWFQGGVSFIKEGTDFPALSTGGEKTHTLTQQELPNIQLKVQHSQSGGSGYGAMGGANPQYTGNIMTEAIGGGLAHNNMPPYFATFWIIKLANGNAQFTFSIDANEHLIITYSDGSTQDCGAIPAGPTGKSAYQEALDNGFVGTAAQWLASLVGPQGPQGLQGAQGNSGTNGTNGTNGDTPYIGSNGNWWIGTTDTGTKASGVITEISDCDLALTQGHYSLIGSKTNTPNNLQNDAPLFVFSNPTANAQHDSIGQLYVDSTGGLWYRNNYDSTGFTAWKNMLSKEITYSGDNATTGAITIDFQYDIYRATDSGSTALALTTFANLPLPASGQAIEKLLILSNTYTAAKTVAFRTADLVVNGITYSFINLDASLSIHSNKQAEISYLWIRTGATTAEVRVSAKIMA